MTTSATPETAPITPPWASRRQARRKGPLVAVGVALLVAAGAWGGYKWTQRPAAVAFVTTPADRGTITAKVTASGTLAAVKTVDVGSQVSGRLQEVYVDFNSPVKKGQVLARIDPQLLEAARQQAQANYVSSQASMRRAQAQVALAERQEQRSAELARQEFIAPADLDAARTEATVARAQLTVAEAAMAQAAASLQQANVNLRFTDIVSPIDGVVIARNVAVGQTVAASLQAPVLFQLAGDLERLEVHSSVSEADVGRLKAGMPVEFTVDAFPGETFKGTVRQIRNAPQTVQNVVTYDAVIDVPNPGGKLRIGMTANVAFIEASHENVLRVPNAALRYQPSEAARPPRPEGARRGRAEAASAEAPATAGAAAESPRRRFEGARNAKRVWVLEGQAVKPVRIRTGLTDGSFTEVVGGELTEGAAVVTDEQGPGAAASPAPQRGRGRMGRFL